MESREYTWRVESIHEEWRAEVKTRFLMISRNTTGKILIMNMNTQSN